MREENSETPWALLHSVTVGRIDERQALWVAYQHSGLETWRELRYLMERADENLNVNAFWPGD